MCVDSKLRKRFGGGETAWCERGRRFIDYEPLCHHRGNRHASAPAVNADHGHALLGIPNMGDGYPLGTRISTWGMDVRL